MTQERSSFVFMIGFVWRWFVFNWIVIQCSLLKLTI